MSDVDYNKKIVDNFSGWLEEHKHGARAVGWGRPQSQIRRFEVIADLVDFSGQSVLDVGCGLGDFKTWLDQRNCECRYTGVDITPAMIDKAKTIHKDSTFHNQDFNAFHDANQAAQTKFDYVIASGIFMYDRPNAEEEILSAATKMFQLSAKGVAFNLLSMDATHKEDDEFYADPVRFLSACRTITKQVAVRHDYHPADFTCFLFKG